MFHTVTCWFPIVPVWFTSICLSQFDFFTTSYVCLILLASIHMRSPPRHFAHHQLNFPTPPPRHFAHHQLHLPPTPPPRHFAHHPLHSTPHHSTQLHPTPLHITPSHTTPGMLLHATTFLSETRTTMWYYPPRRPTHSRRGCNSDRRSLREVDSRRGSNSDACSVQDRSPIKRVLGRVLGTGTPVRASMRA